MKTALLIYANGSEDLEITASADILNRGGVKVVRAALNDDHSKTVTLAHGTVVVCDKPLAECQDDYDVIIIPGGLSGSEHCRDSKVLLEKLKAQQSAGKIIAAICAAPGFVLNTHGFLKGGVKATCYPGCNDGTIEGLQADGVVYDEKAHIVTGKGPGFAIDFALKILEILQGSEVRNKVAAGMLLAN
ncbi:MAG: DJ-1/PfpI family protein [Desulfovibrionaceae bacterium]|nr:DJ-1/PfpI family protein [Desulfovibrionaceae bacterium]